MASTERCKPLNLALALLCALSACPAAYAPVSEEIPQQRALAVIEPIAPLPEGLWVGLSGAAAPAFEEAAPAPEAASLLGAVGALQSGGGSPGGNTAYTGTAYGSYTGSTGYGTGADEYGSATTPTTPSAGGSEYDLTSSLFDKNAQAFTQAVLASGTESAAISIQGMLQLPDLSISTLQEALSGPDPGASAVAKAATGGWQLAVCANPEQGQDATAMAMAGGGPLAAAAARGIARAALICCSKVAGHLGGAATSLEADPGFVQELQQALAASGSNLPTCAVPTQFRG